MHPPPLEPSQVHSKSDEDWRHRVYGIEIDRKARRATDFLSSYDDLKALLSKTGFALHETRADERTLSLVVIADPLEPSRRRATVTEL